MFLVEICSNSEDNHSEISKVGAKTSSEMILKLDIFRIEDLVEQTEKLSGRVTILSLLLDRNQ